MRRLFVKALALVVVLVAVVLVVAYVYARRSLPLVDGSVRVAGLSAPVEIVRDADAIAHIFASTKLDALYGLGYAHAQDRLWQMEFQRRIGHGRLSEIFGTVTLPQDRFFRTVGFARAARAAWDTMPQATKRQVDAYVAGVNALITTHRGSALPPEFTLLRFAPEPWTGVDVVVWVKMMAWDLSANYSYELLRHDIVSRVGADRMAELMPPYPSGGLSILSARDMKRLQPAPSAEARGAREREPSAKNAGGGAPPPENMWGPASIAKRLRPERGAGGEPGEAGPPSESERGRGPASIGKSWRTDTDSFAAAFRSGLSAGNATVRDFLLGGATTESLGSNNWVADGTLTATGKPLLANDPHLATHVPSLWYLAHMSAGDFDVIGATLPGTPAVAIGRNRFIAWGGTNVAADVEDLYRERLDSTGTFVEFRGTQEPVRFVAETIDIKGAPPVRLDVRITRHGPLVSDAINANNAELKRGPRLDPLEPLAFRWTALDAADLTLDAFMRLNEARNWNDFTAALRDYVVPSQNFVYGDVEGHIGYYAPGHIPIRAHGDGSRPADGWTGEAEWTGWIPFEELPHTYDPPEHFIVTANHRPVAAGYPYLLALEYPEPYRAQRITDLLRQKPKLTPNDFASIQADTLSLHALALLPTLLAHARPKAAADQQAADMLRLWNNDARGDSAAAAVFEAWFLRLAPTLVGDELGPLLTKNYEGRFTYITRFIVNTLATNDNAWCDDVRTPKRETCDEAVTTALHDGVVDLTRRLGGNMSRWRWDAVHRAVFPHQGLDAIAALRPLLSRSVPSAGDWSTVNVGPVAADQPFEQHSVPGYRQIVDLSPRNDSRFLDAVGESGHPLSRHYDDFLTDWAAVRHRPMRMDRKDIEAGAIGHLRLTPE